MTKQEIQKLAQDAIDTDRVFAYDVWELKLHDWKKYGKDRTYVDAVRYTLMGKVSHVIKMGYLDNISGEYVASRREYDLIEGYIR